MSAPKTFAVYEKKHASGNVGYRVDLGLINGKRTFKNFPSRVKAHEFSRKCLKAEAQKHPSLLAEIDAVTRHEVLAAMAKLKEHRASITDAVDFFLKHSRPVKADATIGQVITEFRAVKEKAGLSKKYLDTSTRCFFGPFRDHFKDGLITDVTGDACEKYIYQHKGWNHTSRATHIRHLNVLFNFAIDKGYASLNPFEKVQRPKRQANNSSDKVLKVEGVIKLLQYALKHDYKPECAALVPDPFLRGARGRGGQTHLGQDQAGRRKSRGRPRSDQSESSSCEPYLRECVGVVETGARHGKADASELPRAYALRAKSLKGGL